MSVEKEYRESGWEEKMRTNLVVPYTEKGERDESGFAATKDLDTLFCEKLTERQRLVYVGAAHYGSQKRGYATDADPDPTKNSDTDVAIFLDYEKLLRMDSDIYLEDVFRFEREMRHLARAITSGRHINLSFVHLNFEKPLRMPESGYLVFGETAIGPRVEAFKRRYSEMIRGLPEREQEEHIEKLAAEAIQREEKRLPRVRERIKHLTSAEAHKLFKNRKNMWKDRFRQEMGLAKYTKSD